ncbi:MAG: SUMF1/EgtB/PvdO family nonheme iron enzyme [Planctomycetes bacterium]|nr:SUMF1/EgtB/PvdO family nonheme iron enzyme [Planctomycetota bacterium]
MIDRTCPGCGETVPAGARYCPACATPVGDAPAAGDSTAIDPGGEAHEGDEDRTPPFEAGKVLGEYRIVERIGSGGFGHVYRAVNKLLPKQQFALKTLKPMLAKKRRLRTRFLQEAQVLLELEHPNLVPIRHVGEAGGHLYIVMTLCAGRPLRAILRETPRIPMARVAAVASQVLAGLEHAHAKRIVHRDLKPSNILIDTNAPGGWHVRVIDFGIAKLLLEPNQAEDKEGELSLTGGALLGTRAYMSPEQFSTGKIEVDARSDLWSLGVVLHEMVVGEPPTPIVSTPISFAAAGLGDDLPGFEALILTALEKNPEARHASARAMKHELDAILRAAEEQTSRPDPVPSPPAPDSSRSPSAATDTTNTETSTPSEAAPPPPPGVGGWAVVESSGAGTATSSASTLDVAAARSSDRNVADAPQPAPAPAVVEPQSPSGDGKPPALVAEKPHGAPVAAKPPTLVAEKQSAMPIAEQPPAPALPAPAVVGRVDGFPLVGPASAEAEARTRDQETGPTSKVAAVETPAPTPSAAAVEPQSPQRDEKPLPTPVVVKPSAAPVDEKRSAAPVGAKPTAPPLPAPAVVACVPGFPGAGPANAVTEADAPDDGTGPTSSVSALGVPAPTPVPGIAPVSAGPRLTPVPAVPAAAPVKPSGEPAPRAPGGLDTGGRASPGSGPPSAGRDPDDETPPSQVTRFEVRSPVVSPRAPARTGLGRGALLASAAVVLGLLVTAWVRPEWFGLAALPVESATRPTSPAPTPDLAQASARADFEAARRRAEAAVPAGELPLSEHPYDAAVQIAREFATKHTSDALGPDAAKYVAELERREAEALKTAHDSAVEEAREKVKLGDWSAAEMAVGRARGFMPASTDAVAVAAEIRAGRAKAAFASVKAKALAAVPNEPPADPRPFRAAVEMVRAFADGPDAGPSADEARAFLRELEQQGEDAVKHGHDNALADARARVKDRAWEKAHAGVERALAFDPLSTEADRVREELNAALKEAQYAAAMSLGEAALKASDFDTADTRFGEAAKLRTADAKALDGISRAKAARTAEGVRKRNEDFAARGGGAVTTIDLGGGVKLELVFIPAGDLRRALDPDWSELDQVVTVTKPFDLGKFEVTQEQWQAVMGENPSHFKVPKNPVETVSWDDCQRFVAKLNQKVTGGGFRLPEEAEWEYACRAGGTAEYPSGDNATGLEDYAWYGQNSGGTTHPVGQKRANTWGLYDMRGNVWEWCAEWHDEEFDGSPQAVQERSERGTHKAGRVLRGGCWYGDPGDCSVTRRGEFVPDHGFGGAGVRVARSR